MLFKNKNILIFIIVIFLSGCGKKNKNFLVFDNEKKPEKINKLTLPTIRGLTIKTISVGQKSDPNRKKILLEWQKPELTGALPPMVVFVGYNIYKFSQEAFIPKNPINKEIIKTEYFELAKVSPSTYKHNKQKSCYVVRPVFKNILLKKSNIKKSLPPKNRKNFLIEGPTSKVVFLKN